MIMMSILEEAAALAMSAENEKHKRDNYFFVPKGLLPYSLNSLDGCAVPIFYPEAQHYYERRMVRHALGLLRSMAYAQGLPHDSMQALSTEAMQALASEGLAGLTTQDLAVFCYGACFNDLGNAYGLIEVGECEEASALIASALGWLDMTALILPSLKDRGLSTEQFVREALEYLPEMLKRTQRDTGRAGGMQNKTTSEVIVAWLVPAAAAIQGTAKEKAKNLAAGCPDAVVRALKLDPSNPDRGLLTGKLVWRIEKLAKKIRAANEPACAAP